MQQAKNSSVWDQVCRSFERAAESTALQSHRYQIGNESIEIRYAGSRLEGYLHPALAHRERPESGHWQASLTIDVFVSQAPPVRLSKEDWLATQHFWQQGKPFEAATFVTYGATDSECLIAFSLERNRAFVCLQSLENVNNCLRAMPLREVLNLWFQQRGGQIVHAACIADNDSAVLIVGSGGAGKSNTALTCLAHPELSYLSDDVCLVRQGQDAAPTAHSLYNSAKLWEKDLCRYPHLPTAEAFGNPTVPDDKPAFLLFPEHAENLADQRRISAILLARVTDQPVTNVRPAKSADTWRAVVPSTLSVVLGNRPHSSAALATLVQSVPSYWLELGSQRKKIPQVVYQFLSTQSKSTQQAVA